MMNRCIEILARKRNDSGRIPRPPVFSGKGFTLIELLVVIAIIALLVSILLPSLTKAKQLASLTACSMNERAIGIASQMYTHENDGWLVPAVLQEGYYPPWNSLLTGGGYAENRIFHCPSHKLVDHPNPEDPLYQDARSYTINPYITSNPVYGAGEKHLKYDEAEALFGADKMCLLYEAWRVYGVDNTVDKKEENWCYTFWVWNTTGSAEHMPTNRINYLFLDGHVAAYEHIFTSAEWPQLVYDWYYWVYKI